jgi:hypothetical protein
MKSEVWSMENIDCRVNLNIISSLVEISYISVKNEHEQKEGIKEYHYDIVHCIIMFGCKGQKMFIRHKLWSFISSKVGHYI